MYPNESKWVAAIFVILLMVGSLIMFAINVAIIDNTDNPHRVTHEYTFDGTLYGEPCTGEGTTVYTPEGPYDHLYTLNAGISSSERKESVKIGLLFELDDVPSSFLYEYIGELFVIRSAGNVVDGCTLGSLEYAVGHMGVNLIVVMGHRNCGAIAEAIRGFDERHSIEIINDIRDGIGDETDPDVATVKNVLNSVRLITEDIDYSADAKVIGAVYDIRTGKVEFLD